MKITKRQLKRIIREEYSRLKRRGLIRETYSRGRRLLHEHVDEIDKCLQKGMSKQEIFHHIKRQEKAAGKRPNFKEIYDTIDGVMQGRL